MDGSLILFNLLNPPVLFFFLGMIAVFAKSDLEIPAPLPKLFSLYLLVAIGFKGGHELSESGINLQIAITLIAAIAMATLVPIYTFFILKTKLDSYNSVAIAATYGSISAVTFITASSFLRLELDGVLKILENVDISGYTVIDHTSGKGDRGMTDSDLGRAFTNTYILAVCTNEKQLNLLTDKVTPLLRKVGGICLVTEATWINFSLRTSKRNT
ncbi:MAG: sodium-dependent bicarbonate transport family permease [Waterburya sp.]